MKKLIAAFTLVILLSNTVKANATQASCANGHLCFSMCADRVNICGICMGAYCIAVCESDGESLCLDTNQGGQANILIQKIYPFLTATPTATATATP